MIGLSTQAPPARVPSAVLDNQALASNTFANQVQTHLNDQSELDVDTFKFQVLLGGNDTNIVVTTTESPGEAVVVNIDYESDSEFVILDNPIGAGGECRRNYHCKGRERCVLRFREYM